MATMADGKVSPDLSCVVHYVLVGLVIILCLCAVGCLTGRAVVVASIFVVLLGHGLTTTNLG